MNGNGNIQILARCVPQSPNKVLHPAPYSFARRFSSLRFQRRVNLIVRPNRYPILIITGAATLCIHPTIDYLV